MNKLFYLLIALAVPFSVSAATTLYEFYQGKLPTIAERALIYESNGLGMDYKGTAEQNTALLQALQNDSPAPLFGASLDIPTTVAFFETSLLASISETATSFTLVSATDKTGTALASSTYAFVIDEGTSNEEIVIADCTSTACTNATRGVSVLTGTSTVSSLKKAHRRGASVKITDAPIIMNLTRIINGIGAYPNIVRYSSEPTFTTQSTQFVTVNYAEDYANNVIAGGAPTSTETIGGKVELATQIEMASSTDLGTEKPTVLQAKYATSTCTILGLYAVITANDGKITNTCLDQTENYTWSGTHSFSGQMTVTSTTTNGSYVKPDSTFGSWGGAYLPTGTMLSYASSTPPTGFLACNGAAVSRTTYTMLYAVIGTTYGPGDGSTTFNVPDARGRNILHASSTVNMSQSGGESNHTLTTAEIPAHTHTIVQDVTPNDGGFTLGNDGDGTPDTTTDSGSTGGGGAHNVLDPYLVAFCIIKI